MALTAALIDFTKTETHIYSEDGTLVEICWPIYFLTNGNGARVHLNEDCTLKVKVDRETKTYQFYEFLELLATNFLSDEFFVLDQAKYTLCEVNDDLCELNMTEYIKSNEIRCSKKAGVFRFAKYETKMDECGNWIFNDSTKVSHFEIFEHLDYFFN